MRVFVHKHRGLALFILTLFFIGTSSWQPAFATYHAWVHGEYSTEYTYPQDYGDDNPNILSDTMNYTNPSSQITISGTADLTKWGYQGLVLDAYSIYVDAQSYGELQDTFTIPHPTDPFNTDSLPSDIYINIDYYCWVEDGGPAGSQGGASVYHKFQDYIGWDGVLSTTPGGGRVSEKDTYTINATNALGGINYNTPFTITDRWYIATNGNGYGGWGQAHLDPALTFYSDNPNFEFTITSEGGYIPEPATLTLLGLGVFLLRKRNIR